VRTLKLSIYWLSRRVGLFALAGWLTRGHLKILCYHAFELRDETAFRPRLFMSGRVFHQRMQTLKRSGVEVVPLDLALRQLYSGTLRPNTVVITIDDGFQSVHEVAVPILKAHGFPATLYVTSYYVEHDAAVYRLVVQYMFERTAMLWLTLTGEEWHPDGVLDLADATQKEAAVERCIRYGENADEPARRRICQRLGQLLNVSYEDIERTRSFHLLRPTDVAALDADGIDIQLHTHRHQFSMDDFEQVRREVLDNRAALTKIVDGERRHFCYPSGEWRACHGPWLERLGVVSATTCLPGLNDANTSPYELRRFVDGEDIHQLEFEAALCGFSDLLRGLRERFSALRRPVDVGRNSQAVTSN
jgi:peptidoglycan/xylan/chitin deacetylase (PgdA/CDA1 family)